VATDAWAFEHLLQRPGRLPDYLYMAEQKGSGKVNYKDRIKVVT
jgi:beta-xylosidase